MSHDLKVVKPQRVKLVFITIITTAICLSETATDIYVPAMPSIAYEFNAVTSEVKLTISMYLLAVALGGLFQGPLSDRYGRRPIFMIFLAIFLGGTIACSFAINIVLLIIFRCIQGIGASAALSVGMASLRDVFTGIRFGLVMSRISFVIAVSPGIAPVIGAYFNARWGWREVFLCQALMIFILFFSAWFWYTETAVIFPIKKNHPHSVKVYYLYILRNKKFMVFAAIQAMIFSSIFIEVSSLPFLYINYHHVDKGDFGLYMAFSVFWYAIGAAINQLFLTRFGLQKMVVIGLFMQMLTCCLIVFISLFIELNPREIHFLKIPGSIGLAFVFGNAVPQALSALSKNVGTGAALITFSQMMLAGGGVLVSSMLPLNTPISIYLPYLLLVMMCFLILICLRPYESLKNPPIRFQML